MHIAEITTLRPFLRGQYAYSTRSQSGLTGSPRVWVWHVWRARMFQATVGGYQLAMETTGSRGYWFPPGIPQRTVCLMVEVALQGRIMLLIAELIFLAVTSGAWPEVNARSN